MIIDPRKNEKNDNDANYAKSWVNVRLQVRLGLTW